MKAMKHLFTRNRAAKKNSSVQEWIPVQDVNNDLLLRRDNSLVAILRLTPINMSLLSETEQEEIIVTLKRILNGVTFSMQWLSLSRAVDLDRYILQLEKVATLTNNFTRKKLLKSYIREAAQISLGGQAITREFYILISCQNSHGMALRIKSIANELASTLHAMGLNPKLCDDQDIIELLFAFNNPVHASNESISHLEQYYIPPIKE